MKVLSTAGLTKLIELIKSSFISVDDTETTTEIDTETTSEVTLATVATSGSYNDLSNKPTIPTVNNATLTIQKNGTTVNTFTANASNNVTADITVPTKTSDITNDSGFITSSALSGYATETWVGQQGFITGITSSDVTTALGFTPYNSSNPSGYQANVIETIKVNGTSLTPSSKSVDISVPTNNNQLTNGAGYITSSALSGYQTTANLVTSVSSSSTDTQYPSAKLFYDTVGDIESVLNTINSGGAQTVTLTFVLTGTTANFGYLNVNNTTYQKSNFNNNSLSLEFESGTNISWSATPQGKGSVTPSSGTLTITEDTSITINVT